MDRQWTNVGKEYTKTDKQKIELGDIFSNIRWYEIPLKESIGFSQGYAIKSAIQSYKIPNVKRVGESNDLSPYGLIAIEGNYKNGQAISYFVDSGIDLTPICIDFTSNG